MRTLLTSVFAVMLAAIVPGAALARQTPTPQTKTTDQKPPAKPADPNAQTPDQTYKETVVVSASKTEEQLVDAPATMSVIGQKELTVAPSANYGDLMRNVPGVNVTQISARDINLTSRAATGSLATSQLAVLDGRSLYQDFFGFVMWDFMPVNLDEIKRIEVIRGPASAVWGANALDGVINVITKSPREMQGTSVTIGAGTFGRDFNDNGATRGSLFYVNGSHAQAVNDRWSYKLSAGSYTSDPFGRPTGLIPNGSGTSYPTYTNAGTTQPKFDGRVDYDGTDGSKISISGGVAGTSGIMHSGIGPFDIQNGSVQGYGQFNYTKRAWKVQAFYNGLNGTADQLLTVDAQGHPITFDFNTKTFDVEVGNSMALGTHNALTYGGNLRHNTFDLSIAPNADPRTEGGAYVQDEVLLNDAARVVLGGRVDKFSSIQGAVFSPRVAFVYKLDPNNSVRVSYNRAYRAPSAINNFLDVSIAEPVPMAAFHPAYGAQVYLLPIQNVGNPDLQEETLDAFEIGYTGVIRHRATVTAAVYFNRLQNQILFTQIGAYSNPLVPPPGFPDIPGVPGSGGLVWGGAVLQGVALPSTFSYENFGREKDKGIELGIDTPVSKSVSVFANYAFQADPVVNFDVNEINQPAKNHFNAGLSCDTPRGFGSISVSYVDHAYWQDVLDAPYHGTTPSYTMINASAGYRFAAGKYTAVLKVTDLGNKQIQQHIFGDVMRRAVVGELRIKLPK